MKGKGERNRKRSILILLSPIHISCIQTLKSSCYPYKYTYFYSFYMVCLESTGLGGITAYWHEYGHRSEKKVGIHSRMWNGASGFIGEYICISYK